MERIYTAGLWAELVKKNSNYACSESGSAEGLQAVHLTPPSLGGRNTLENGIALCVRCYSKSVIGTSKVRFNFSVPADMYGRLDTYCQKSGRSVNDVVKQLLADFLLGSEFTPNGYHDAERNDRRLSFPVLSPVFKEFSGKCRSLNVQESEVVKSLLHRYLNTFEGGKS